MIHWYFKIVYHIIFDTSLLFFFLKYILPACVRPVPAIFHIPHLSLTVIAGTHFHFLLWSWPLNWWAPLEWQVPKNLIDYVNTVCRQNYWKNKDEGDVNQHLSCKKMAGRVVVKLNTRINESVVCGSSKEWGLLHEWYASSKVMQQKFIKREGKWMDGYYLSSIKKCKPSL